jgi:hypothetical protein
VFVHFDANQDGFIDFQEVFNQFYHPKRIRQHDRFGLVMDKIKAAIDANGGNIEDIFSNFSTPALPSNFVRNGFPSFLALNFLVIFSCRLLYKLLYFTEHHSRFL